MNYFRVTAIIAVVLAASIALSARAAMPNIKVPAWDIAEQKKPKPAPKPKTPPRPTPPVGPRDGGEDE